MKEDLNAYLCTATITISAFTVPVTFAFLSSAVSVIMSIEIWSAEFVYPTEKRQSQDHRSHVHNNCEDANSRKHRKDSVT